MLQRLPRVSHEADQASTLQHTRSAHNLPITWRLPNKDPAIRGQKWPSQQTEVTDTTLTNLVSSKQTSS